MNTIKVDRKEVAEQHGPNGVLVTATGVGEADPWLEILVHDGIATIKTDKARIEVRR